MKHAFFLLTTILASAFGMRCAGQEFAVKTNVLYDATMTINLGAELEVAPKWSVELSGNFNGWNMGNGRRWKHWLVQPEARYWFCEALGGHFLGMHLLGGKYNIGHACHAADFNALWPARYTQNTARNAFSRSARCITDMFREYRKRPSAPPCATKCVAGRVNR